LVGLYEDWKENMKTSSLSTEDEQINKINPQKMRTNMAIR